ncbi:hypothetical protein M408DRAFT_8152 [Serendipita vermifera MAFF 305830]|uniref:Uncharacterized protein n=1 Tax=Serendipita vermifera MAFF 305830 TaxID=933852 RepID=A0A0C3BDE6_SERVB|nr:hypothetical protein M408DRAFT_8152 [Serendipita vermifera MAFF 305830]
MTGRILNRARWSVVYAGWGIIHRFHVQRIKVGHPSIIRQGNIDPNLIDINLVNLNPPPPIQNAPDHPSRHANNTAFIQNSFALNDRSTRHELRTILSQDWWFLDTVEPQGSLDPLIMRQGALFACKFLSCGHKRFARFDRDVIGGFLVKNTSGHTQNERRLHFLPHAKQLNGGQKKHGPTQKEQEMSYILTSNVLSPMKMRITYAGNLHEIYPVPSVFSIQGKPNKAAPPGLRHQVARAGLERARPMSIDRITYPFFILKLHFVTNEAIL